MPEFPYPGLFQRYWHRLLYQLGLLSAEVEWGEWSENLLEKVPVATWEILLETRSKNLLVVPLETM